MLLPLKIHGLDLFVKLVEGFPVQLQTALLHDKKGKPASFDNP